MATPQRHENPKVYAISANCGVRMPQHVAWALVRFSMTGCKANGPRGLALPLAPGRPSVAGSRRSMGRGVKVAGGQIDEAGLLPIGESGF
jgi:hypothetical protein